MRSYKSPEISLKDSNAALVFLSTPSNFEKLMPESIQSFTATDEGFRFQLSGMPAIHLKKKVSEGLTYYENQGGSVSFGLHFNVTNNTLTFEVKGTISTMVNMMLSKPLTNLLANFSDKLLKLEM